MKIGLKVLYLKCRAYFFNEIMGLTIRFESPKKCDGGSVRRLRIGQRVSWEILCEDFR